MTYPTIRYFSYGNLRLGYVDCLQNSNLPKSCQTAIGEFLKQIPILYKVENLVVLGDTQADSLFMDIVKRSEIKTINVGCYSAYDKLGQFIQHTIKPTTTNKGRLFTKHLRYDAEKEALELVINGPDELK